MPFHIVLIEPEIPWNTGNVGRTCLAAGAELHLVGGLGFFLGQAEVKRAGLDYWDKVALHRHETWEAFLQGLPPEAALFFFSTKGEKTLWEAKFPPGAYLIFGKETAGLPKEFYERYKDRLYRIPQKEDSVRSLNLSTSAGIALFEALRQNQA
ncbi:MAG TPA: tRNA (cytidine(34)-2'-O)-methyltransferase [bacterium]|nr:tRNA (cytidine(34)-2'-O)-methyltransferase [bacterium]